MARAATSSDVFNAVAEPCRRTILDQLALGERPVGDLVDAMALAQPSVSKHLRVLKEVGLVATRRDGRRMFYRLDANGLRAIHDWTATFERYWDRQLDRVKERAEAKQRGQDRHRPADRNSTPDAPDTPSR
jgi:DNA-binding transcriptional ArsR family regulator